MELQKHDLFVAGGVVVALGLVVIFMKNQGGGGGVTPSSSGSAALVGGYTTAQTVYVPTSSYDINYLTNNGTMVTNTTNNQTSVTYAPTQNNNGGLITHPVIDPGTPIISTTPPVIKPTPPVAVAHPIEGPPPALPVPHPPTPTPTPKPPTLVTPSKPTPTTYHAPTKPIVKPAPKPAPKPNPILSVLKKGTKYSTPKTGWDKNSVVDLLKANGDANDYASRQKLAAAAGIKGYTGTASQNTSLIHSLEGAGLKY